MLSFCQFFVSLLFSVTVLKKLHRKTPFGKADARHKLSPRKVHPVLRIKRTEKDWFTTQQKNYFSGYLMNVFLGIVKQMVF